LKNWDLPMKAILISFSKSIEDAAPLISERTI